MKKRNKSYLLFLYGQWMDDNEFIRDIRDTLLLVVDSGYLKFVHGPASAILSFKSQEDFEDITEYLEGALPKYIDSYIFIPKPRKMSFRLPNDMDKHLFDVETNTNDLVEKQLDQEMEIDLSMDEAFLSGEGPFGNLDEIMGRIDKMFEEFVTDVKKITTTNHEDFDLDNILDKITEKGVSSLSEEEREFLDNHNKNN